MLLETLIMFISLLIMTEPVEKVLEDLKSLEAAILAEEDEEDCDRNYDGHRSMTIYFDLKILSYTCIKTLIYKLVYI